MSESEICVLPETTEKTECVEREPAWVNLPKGEVELTTNGRHDVGRYETALVNVDAPSGTIELTGNGEYDVERYATANVNVPLPTGEVKITRNGQYDVEAYVTADVKVPQPEGSIAIAENGTHDVKNYETAEVNVAGDISEFWETPATISSRAVQEVTGHAKKLPQITVASTTTSIHSLFAETYWRALEEIAVVGGGPSLTTIAYLFAGDNVGRALTHVDLSGLSAGNITTLERLCYQCTNLESIKLPTLLTAPTGTVSMQNMFNRCSSLKKIDLTELGQPLNVSSFSYCFGSCTSLEYLDMSNILNVSNWSNFLTQCSSLKTLILGGTSVLPLNNASPLVGSGITSGICTIYVPDDLVEQYKTDTNAIWRLYASQIKGVGELPE